MGFQISCIEHYNMPFVPLQGFAPDQDPVTPGLLTDCAAVIPSLRGLEAAPGLLSQGYAALAAKCLGAAVCRKLDAATRFFAGTQTKLYEATSGSWAEVTRAASDYTGGVTSLWRFAQYGNVSLAANTTDLLQFSVSTGVFADIAGAPKAKMVETVDQFVMVFGTNEGTYGDSPDRWWCSAISDYTNWTPAIATQCATGRLTSIPGPIRAGRRLGHTIVAYKARGISLGTYTGPPYVWSWNDLPGEIGAVCQECVVSLGTAHVFMGPLGFYLFDGANVKEIGTQVKTWWAARVDQANVHLSKAVHDWAKGLIYFYYPTSASVGVPVECLVYNYRKDQWGRDDRAIEAAAEFVSTGVTYNGLGTLYSTYDDLPTTITYDSNFWAAGSPVPSVFDTAHTLQALSGVPGNWSLTSGDYGDDQQVSRLSRVRPRFITKPSSAQLVPSYRMALGDALTSLPAVTMIRSRFDVIRSARWHRAQLSGSGSMEIAGIDADMAQAGRE